jgi:arylsulfatase A-like enzyme
MPDALPAEWEEQGPQILRANQESYLNYAEIADDPAAIRRFRALFHGSLRYMDDQIGRIIDHLKASGQWENTIVVFSTDHGEMMGDHGCIAKALPHYDAGIRCPLIVGGGPVGQADSDRLSCTLDLFPTFCQWAGVHEDALPPLEGTSFAGACTPQGDAEGWNAVSISISTINTIVTEGGWRMTQYGPDQGQLFNLREDPDELNNLYWDPAQRDRRSALLEQLTAIQARMRVVPRYANFSLRGEAKIDTASRLIRYPHYGAPPSPWLAEGPLPDWQGEA